MRWRLSVKTYRSRLVRAHGGWVLAFERLPFTVCWHWPLRQIPNCPLVYVYGVSFGTDIFVGVSICREIKATTGK